MPLLPLWAFVACSRVNLTFTFTGRYKVLTAVPNTVFNFRGLERERERERECSERRYMYCYEGEQKFYCANARLSYW